MDIISFIKILSIFYEVSRKSLHHFELETIFKDIKDGHNF